MPSIDVDTYWSSNFQLESKSGGESNCFPGNGTVGTSVTSSLYSYRPVGTRYYASSNPWRCWFIGNEFRFSSVPAGAVILDVSFNFYIRQDDTTQNQSVQLVEHDWGTSWSTLDWRDSSELSVKTLLGSDSSAGHSVGWNVMPADADLIDVVQGHVDNGTDFHFLVVSSTHRSDITMNTSERSVTEIDYSFYDPYLTIDYIVPDNQTIFLGTHF